ncbi:MAG: biotin/lipoyl-containing protein [Chloroflexota bacterium]
MKYSATVNDQEFTIEIVDDHRVRINDEIHEIDFISISGEPVYSLLVDGKSYEAVVYPEDDGLQVQMVGRQYQVQVEDEREKRLRAAGGGSVGESSDYNLKAPMPGLVVSIAVTDGQLVEKNQVLLILESMKMQNELKSPRAGTVTRVRVKAGDSVEQKQLILSVV